MRTLVALSLLFLIAGCHGSGDLTPAAHHSSLPGESASSVPVQLVITIPQATGTAAKRPQYVSPSTASLKLVVNQGTTQVDSVVANLAAGSSGCSATSQGLQCSLTVSLLPNAYTATISTYDGASATGNLLSQGQNIAFSVSATSSTNTIPLALSGVPSSVIVMPGSNAVTGSMHLGFTIGGMQAQPMSAIALDADGNYIVGEGAPQFSVTLASGSGWTLTNPSSTQPNTFTIAPPLAQSRSAAIQVTASYSDGTCSLPGAVCSATFNVRNDLPTLFVSGCPISKFGCSSGSTGEVMVYQPPYTGTPTVLTTGIDTPLQLTADRADRLYIANGDSSTIAQYVPPYACCGTLNTMSFAPDEISGVQVDTAGDILVYFPQVPTATAYQGMTTSVSTWGISPGAGVAESFPPFIDPNDNAYVQSSNSSIGEYSPPSYAKSRDIAIPNLAIVRSIAVDAAGTAYIAMQGSVEIAPLNGSPVSASAPGGDAYYATYDPNGDAIAATPDGIVVITPKGAISSTITNGVNVTSPDFGWGQLLACDSGGDLFVANDGGSTVTVYQPPYTAAPLTLNVPDGYQPTNVVLGP